jgi:MFS family permease
LSGLTSKANSLWTKNFLLLILANFAIYVSFYMLIPSLPVFIKEISGRDSLSGLALGLFLLAAVLIRPFAGRSIDTGKRKEIFLLGTGVFLFSTLAFSLVPTLVVLLAARFVQGLGWAYCNTAAGTLASDIIPRMRLSEGMGYFSLSLSASMGVGPALALYLSERYSFQLMFYACAGFALLSFLLALFINQPNLSSETETRTPPATKKVLLEKKAFFPALVMFFVLISYAAITSFLALYGQYRLVADIGLFFTVFAVSISVSRPLFGRLADRKGHDLVLVPGLILCILTLIIIYFARSLPAFIFAGFVYGTGFGAVQPSMQALSVLFVPPERRGAATATYFLFLDLGLGLGSVLWGLVAQSYGYELMYLAAIIPSLISLFVYLLARQRKTRQVVSGQSNF